MMYDVRAIWLQIWKVRDRSCLQLSESSFKIAVLKFNLNSLYCEYTWPPIMKVSGAIGEKVKHVAVKGRALVALPTENV